MEAAAIDQSSNHLAYVIALAVIPWNNAIQVARVIARWLWFRDIPGNVLAPVEIGDNAAADCQGMFIIDGGMIGHAGNTAMHIGPAQIFRTHLFACRRFDQWRPCEEDGAIATHNHCLIAHSGHVCSSCRAGTHYRGDLWNALARHACLIVKDTPEVFAVGKDIGLQGQECSSRINEVNTWKMILLSNLLGAQVLLYGDWIIC